MKGIFISALILFSGVITAQDCKIDLHSLAQPDFNMNQLNKFGQSGSFKIVLSAGFDTLENRTVIDHLSEWFLNQNSRIHIVNINDIKNLDDSCHYLIIGLISELKDLSAFDLPVKIDNNKCFIGPIDVSDPDDAISIIDQKAQCAAVVGNSFEALRNISFGRFIGVYNYYILKNDEMRFMGNLKDNKFISDSLVDLNLIRKENYSRKIGNEYLEAYFSCKYTMISQFQSSIDDLTDSFDDFCRIYEVNRPSQKLRFYVHNDQTEINIISGDPKPGSTGGFVIDGLIHTVGLDKELLTHEGIHFIFNHNCKSPNAFFNEGIPMSFALFKHPERISTDCKLISDNLDIEGLITGKTAFWNGPYKNRQCLSYQIAGLFVKFLYDKYGIDRLKSFYQYSDVTEGFKTVYNLELPEMVSDWRNYILRNVE